ncbi:MAG: transposase [Christensenellales bacterium]
MYCIGHSWEEEWHESGERNAVESRFGVGKRRYKTGLVKEYLKETSEVSIHIYILKMNL